MNIPSTNPLLQFTQNKQIIMCRGFVENERETLKIRAFYTHFRLSSHPKPKNAPLLPDFLTLHFLPRINGSLLEINGSSIRPDSPAFVTLHRVLSEGGFKYGTRERVTVREGAKFEIYAGDVKLMKGIFRKDDDDSWKMECKSVASSLSGVEGAEVAVAAEGLPGVITEKVEMLAPMRQRRRRKGSCCELEEIPEVREEAGSGGCCCSECGGGEEVDDGGDCEMEVDVDVEAVNWAVDVGIWVMCFGVGYLVSASSLKSFRRKKFI